ncbi:MAG: excinuclease ABC subunit UvrC, partial [Desulfobulbales bacterium]|nr:excinuclease ABC subunit UvrC [Desulfobulbales bacterium]
MSSQDSSVNSAPTSTPAKSGLWPFDGHFFRSIPVSPGVYLMKNRQGKILYVGKAKNLRKRVSSYQRVNPAVSPKTALLLDKVADVETIMTHTEKEAFILEASLIKKYRPRFNIDLKDDKSYPRIKVTLAEEWPRVYVTRRRIKDGSRYFGPYASAAAMRNTLNVIKNLFPLRTCKGRNIKKRERPCLNYQMGRCLAPCKDKVTKAQYSRMVANVLMILEGKNRELRARLQTEMFKAADKQEFEKAAHVRDQLQALEKTLEKQIVVSNIDRDQDVFGYVRRGAGVGIAVMKVKQGMVCGQQVFFLLDPIGDDSEVLGEVLRQYYNREQVVPDELLLPFRVVGHTLLGEWLSEMRGRKMQLRVPQRGEALKLLNMAAVNARQVHIDQENRERGWQELARNLQTKLHLRSFPSRVECLDISNIGGKQPVGSLVCYLDGEKAPGEYRHYSISGAHEPDDYRMMAEVLTRRFTIADKKGILPDLLVVDGGKGHLNIALNVLRQQGLEKKVELVAIAKNKAGKGDKIYRPGRKNSVKLALHSPVLFFLMQIRDESHRFGVSFHRRLRRKKILASELDKVPGIGPARRKMLLKTMGSMAKVKKAKPDELAAVPGIGLESARHIWNFFHAG